MAGSDSRRGGSQPTPSEDTLFPARLQAGEISTAAAVHNPGEERIVVSCRLMSKSTVLEEVEIPLGGQRADVLAHRPGVPRRRYVRRRLALQGGLDAEKEQAERNRMGQFATPTGSF